MKPVQATEKNFDEIISSNKTVLVDFWAPWCGPCKMLSPVLDEFGEENDDLVIAKLNVDENMDVVRKYSIAVIPALLLFKNGQLSNKSVGFLTKDEIKKFVDNN